MELLEKAVDDLAVVGSHEVRDEDGGVELAAARDLALRKVDATKQRAPRVREVVDDEHVVLRRERLLLPLGVLALLKQ